VGCSWRDLPGDRAQFAAFPEDLGEPNAETSMQSPDILGAAPSRQIVALGVAVEH
jgi:hypothetical protein